MGMYTELRTNFKLRPNTPAEVIRVLSWMANCSSSEPPPFELPSHPLFSCPRWGCLMRMSSAYFDDRPSAAVVKWRGQFHVLSVANLKNYDGEIEKFLDWVRPYVHALPGDVWAQWQYEEDDTPTDVIWS